MRCPWSLRLSLIHISISGIRPEIEWLGSKKLMGIPVLVIVFIICAAVVSIMLQKTAFGKKIYALGGNQEAALSLIHI